MRSLVSFLVAVIAATQLAAAPQITSITPNSGPATGGTTVTIRGSFESCIICSPPIPAYVTFGGVAALSTTVVDSSTIVAVTPPMVALRVDVTVDQYTGAATLPQGFTFTDDQGYEPILLPIFSPPVAGAFGSQFITEVVAANRTYPSPVSIIGIDESCFITTPPSPGPLVPRVLPGVVGTTRSISPDCSRWPARLLYVRSDLKQQVSFNVRVHDTSRNALSHGTEIPVVRRTDFTNDPIVLAGVPNSDRFRSMLRIYAMDKCVVTVRVQDSDTELHLQPGNNLFQPAYGAMRVGPPFRTAPASETYSVSIFPPSPASGPSPTIYGIPIWAFITVTNNETQEITTITPDL